MEANISNQEFKNSMIITKNAKGMTAKIITPEIADAIKNLEIFEIPLHFQATATSLNIKNIYFLDTDLSSVGIYGNCIVELTDDRCLDIQITPNNIDNVLLCCKCSLENNR